MQNPNYRMKRLLASDLLPQRAGSRPGPLVHIYFAELREMDADSALQDEWIADYRAQWVAHRAAASVGTGDGGAWLEGDAARAAACDAVEHLIALCVRYHTTRAQAATNAAASPEALAMLEHQILGMIIQMVSGPGGVASFLCRSLLGKA